MNPRDRLQELFTHFPGIGPRQAKRFVYFLLTRNSTYLAELSRLIKELQGESAVCASCFRFYSPATKGSLCSLCGDEGRDKKTLLLVEKDVDLETIEKSKTYTGLYFVLGGSVPILEKNPEKLVRLKELQKIAESRKGVLSEIILALSVTPEGEHTAEYIKGVLSALPFAKNMRVTLLGRGLSTGSEVEYTDPETLKNALKNRS